MWCWGHQPLDDKEPIQGHRNWSCPPCLCQGQSWRSSLRQGDPKEGGRQRHEKLIEVFADIAYGASSSFRSIQGLVICFAGAPISWQSSTQPFITHSTAEAELVSTAGHSQLAGLLKLSCVPCGGSALKPPTHSRGSSMVTMLQLLGWPMAIATLRGGAGTCVFELTSSERPCLTRTHILEAGGSSAISRAQNW